MVLTFFHRIRGGAASNNAGNANAAADANANAAEDANANAAEDANANAAADLLGTLVWAAIAFSSLVVFGVILYAYLCSTSSLSPTSPASPSPESPSPASPSPASPSPTVHRIWTLASDLGLTIACPVCTITAFYLLLLSLEAPGRSLLTRISAACAFLLVSVVWVIMITSLHAANSTFSSVTVAIVDSLNLGLCYIGLGALALPAGPNAQERSFLIQIVLHITAHKVVLDSSVWAVALYAAWAVTLFCFSKLLDSKDSLQVVRATSVSFASAICQVCVVIFKLIKHGHFSHILNPYCIHIGIFLLADVPGLLLHYFDLKDRPSNVADFIKLGLPPTSYMLGDNA